MGIREETNEGEANLQSPSLTQNANNLVAFIHRSNSMAAVACTCIILKSLDERRQNSTLRTRCQTQRIHSTMMRMTMPSTAVGKDATE